MCGLFGEIGHGVLTDGVAIGAISRSILHRGPDDSGMSAGEGWVLGFRRLAILDLSANGHQPLSSRDGRHVLVFNGEVYNYLELKAELLAAGETFRSGTDTEVLLKLLMREGSAALHRLNGMYAFAYLDLDRRRFIIARDRLGVKPLYYRQDRGRLRFASELKALLEWPGTPRELNRAGLLDYLTMGYLPNDSCIFDGYAKLPAGHFIEGDLDRPEVAPRPYWALTIQPEDRGAEADTGLMEELEALLADAVRIRMRSDVPVALLLSGGIDSGLVASYAAATGTPPLALVAGVGTDQDETTLARATAAHLGLALQELPFDASDLRDVDSVAETFDEPFADTSALPTLKICAAARRHATVLLTGDGGDEAFGGYRRYVEAQRYAGIMQLPGGLRRAAWALGRGHLPPRLEYRLAKATLPGELLGAVFDGFGLARDPALARLLPRDLAADLRDVARPVALAWAESEGHDLLTRQRAFDYRLYLADDVLVKVDRASMAHSTEVRSPFLDYRLVEWAARLPQRLLVDDTRGKLMLRRLAEARLPAAVTRGQKRGFGAPVDAWLRTPAGAALIRDRLVGHPAPEFWRPEGVEAVLREHLAGKRNYGDLLWRLLVLEAWTRRYMAPGLVNRGLAA